MVDPLLHMQKVPGSIPGIIIKKSLVGDTGKDLSHPKPQQRDCQSEKTNMAN